MDRGIPDAQILEDRPVIIDTLLRAFVARDFSRLPLAADVRYTENGQTLRLGDGLWGTLTGYAGADARGGHDSGGIRPPPYRVDFSDAAAREAVYFGGSLETTTSGVLALRVRQRGENIAEIEAVCVRTEKPGERGGTMTLFQPSLLTPFDGGAFSAADPTLLADVRPGAEDSRAGLCTLVDAYFDALESGDSRKTAFTSTCRRLDNGVQASGDPSAPPLDPAVPAYRPFSLGCAQQIDSGFFRRISRIRGRRHVAVDEARGLVLTVAMFDQPGNVKEIDVPDIGRVALPGGIQLQDLADTGGAAQFYVKRHDPNFRVPMTELTVQLTKLEGGRIAHIESISRGVPFGATDGWGR